MPQYCLVKHHIVSSVIDGPDPGNDPDTLPVSGNVTFSPLLDNGDSVVVTAGEEKISYIIAPITARIVDGKISVEGEEGVKLFAGGPNSNPERIRYRAKFTGLNISGKKVELKNVLFEAVPGGELSLAVAQSVPGAPYPGYSASIEQGLKQIENSRDGAIDFAVTKINETRDGVIHEADLAIQAVKDANALPRVEALEALGGLSPESPVDGQTANLIEQDDTLTRRALASNFAEVGADGKLQGGIIPTLALAASPATGVSVTTESQIQVFTFFNGELIGWQDGNLYTSPDGVNWTDAGRSPLGQIPRKILMTLDGELICAINPSLHRSSGWGTGELTWSKKMDVTPGSGIQPFGLNGRAGKFIVTEYSGDRATSRYAYISTDDGHTFNQVWDSDEMHGPVEGPLTHIHGVEYDHYADRFYLSEGHNDAAAGLYVSVDDGATWVRPPGLFESPAPTTVDVTPDGLVCGSDSGRAGILGVVRQDNPMDEKFIHTWVWQTGQDGVIGFGASSFRDESTGIVYIGFRSAKPGVHPIIAGGTPTAAGLVWEWDGGPSMNTDDVRNPVVVNGRLYAIGKLSGETRHIRGYVASPGVPTDQSQARVIGTKLAVGVGATAAGLGGVAVGNSAVNSGVQWSTAVGHEADAGTDATALGTKSVATQGSTALGYLATTTSGGDQLAVGTRTSTLGSSSTAVGTRAETQTSAVAVGSHAIGAVSGVAVGSGAKSGSTGVAVGRSADSSTGDNSTVVGPNAKATQGHSTSLGSSTTSGSFGVALGSGATAVASGTSLGAQATSAASGVAIGRNAEAGQNMVAIGRNAKTIVGGAIAIGDEAVASAANSVTFGDRSIHLRPLESTPNAPGTGGLLYIRNIDGVQSLCVRMTAGPEIVIVPAAPVVPEPEPEAE